MKFLTTLGLASVASAHTLFTTLHIDGKNQGDGTCVRQPKEASTSNSPIYPIDGSVMACGYGGETAVDFVCPASNGARLTFEFRESPEYLRTGAIDSRHKGPCAVYIRKVDDIMNDSASGDGWFKIWEDGYDVESDTWCVDTLNANNGHLAVDLPTGLPSGYYLVRPEVLALHNANNGDPQFYTGCAQIFITDGPDVELTIPEKYSVSIPGYVSSEDAGLTFNIYDTPLGEYPLPGPEVYIPTSESVGSNQTQKTGVCPSDCEAKNANWCGKPLDNYSTEDACWTTSKNCWAQAETCWDSVPPSGSTGCTTWNNYCNKIDDECNAGNFGGLPDFDLSEINADVGGPWPAPYGSFNTTPIDGSSSGGSSGSSSSATGGSSGSTKTSAYEQPASTGDSSSEDKTSVYVVPSATGDSSSSAETSVYVLPESSETPTPSYSSVPEETSSSSGGDSSGLKISQDGRCGGETGQTCEGSAFGNCCSKKGRCGRKNRHCSCGCQEAFGICN